MRGAYMKLNRAQPAPLATHSHRSHLYRHHSHLYRHSFVQCHTTPCPALLCAPPPRISMRPPHVCSLYSRPAEPPPIFAHSPHPPTPGAPTRASTAHDPRAGRASAASTTAAVPVREGEGAQRSAPENSDGGVSLWVGGCGNSDGGGVSHILCTHAVINSLTEEHRQLPNMLVRRRTFRAPE